MICNARDKKTTSVDKEKMFNEAYGTKYKIPLDHEIRKEHEVFFPRALSDELLFELRLAPVGTFVKGSDAANLAYELTNNQLWFDVIHSQELANEALFNYKNGKRFMCERVTHLESIDEASEAIINETVNVPRRSIKGLLLLFYEPYAAGARESEKIFNPDITKVKVAMNKI